MPILSVRIDPLLAYNVWRSMHKRCNDPKTNGYKNYGEKGIKVCKTWDTYEQFISDMGPRPSPKHHLDRIDSSGNYEKGNCQWITAKENERKKSTTRLIEWKDEIKTLTEWAEELELASSTFAARLRNWGIEKAFTTPRGPSGPKRSGIHD